MAIVLVTCIHNDKFLPRCKFRQAVPCYDMPLYQHSNPEKHLSPSDRIEALCMARLDINCEHRCLVNIKPNTLKVGF